MENNELQHWGILGMKWGRRRYQNKDGSLTPEGKKRYDDDPTNDDSSEDSETRKQRILKSGSAAEVMSLQGQLTNKELSDAYQRLNNERLISEIAQKDVKTGWDKVADITQKVNKVTDLTNAALKGYNLIATVNNTFNDRQLPKIDGKYFRDRLQNQQSRSTPNSNENQNTPRQNGQTDAQRQQQREQHQNQRQREQEQRRRGYHQEDGELVVTNERRYRDAQAQYRELGLRDGTQGQAASNRNTFTSAISRIGRGSGGDNNQAQSQQRAVRGDDDRSISTTSTRTFNPFRNRTADYSNAKSSSGLNGNQGVSNVRDSDTGTMASIRNIVSTFSSTAARNLTSTGRGSVKRYSNRTTSEVTDSASVSRGRSVVEQFSDARETRNNNTFNDFIKRIRN